MFFYHDRMTGYDFGPRHPLKPERLRRTMAVLNAIAPDIDPVDPGLATVDDLARVHSAEYVDVVKALSAGRGVAQAAVESSGFWSGDNPPFPGMYEASLAYCGGSVRAAEAVRDGAPLAFNIAGGLHHARRSQASGFCVFNDCALACSVLRDKFDRVAYVDIDLHHGDGVQWLFYDDPTVLTYSIHESGRYLYPGTGFVEETGTGNTAVNVPLDPMTTGDTWLWAFRETLFPALERFKPKAIVLQMGADPHFDDPLGHLQVATQEWLEAVRLVRDLRLPTVAVGGGGYEMANVPRMWAAAVLTLLDRDFDDRLPASIPSEWGMTTVSDPHIPEPRRQGWRTAEPVVESLRANGSLVRVPRS